MKRENLLVRICFNSKNWRQPTGEMYKQENSYVGRWGFGHEDWNFNTAQAVDDSVYGYAYFTPSESRLKKYNGKFNIHFYAIEPKSKQRLLVGIYKNACYLNKEERTGIQRLFKEHGIINDRADELVALGIPAFREPDKARQRYLKDFYINVKASAENVTIFDPPYVLTKELLGGRSPRALLRYKSGIYLDSPLSPSQLFHEGKLTPLQDLPEDPFEQHPSAEKRVIKRYHNRLSNCFRRWLENIKAQAIRREREGVDFYFQHSSVSYLAELKVCYGQRVTRSIREGIGQILEYNFYPGRNSADKLLIVLDQEPSFTDILYVERIQKYLPLLLLWPSKEGFVSSRKLEKGFHELHAVLGWREAT